MKIVCDSCGAKYSIADEKVAGKVFKIRCKRCSEVIVVRGDQQQPEEDATRVYDYAVDAVWHVVVNGEQQGPFAPPQIGEMLSNAQIDWEAYVWREGFDNWLPARDVPELVEAVTGQNAGGYEEAPAEAYEAPAPVAAAAPAPARAQAQPRSMGADPFADDGGGADAGLFGGGGADAGLFGGGGGAAANPFGGGHDDGVVASAPSPRVTSAQAMTGARNENSVLFSLKNLQALATGGNESGGGGGSTAASPAPRAGFATGEGSGLIDIRALASATGLGNDSGGAGDKDELLSMGGGQTGAFSSLGSPMLAPPLAAAAEETKGKNTMLYVGFGVLAIAVLGMGGGMFYLLTREPQQVVVQAPAAPVAAAAAATPAAAAEGTKPAAEEPTEGEKAAAKAAAEAEEKAGDSEGSGSSRRRRSSGSGSSSAGSEPAASSGSSAREEDEPAPAKTTKSSANATIDDLLGGALGSGSGGGSTKKAAPAPAPASNLPEQPSRDDVMNALRSVDDAVKACGGGQHGVAMAAITVAGNTGRVSSVNVSGQFQGTPVGSCVARAVRAAKFPKFSRPDFKVNFPFRI